MCVRIKAAPHSSARKPGKVDAACIIGHGRSGMRAAIDHPVIITDALGLREGIAAISRNNMEHVPDAVLHNSTEYRMNASLLIYMQICAAALAGWLADQSPGAKPVCTIGAGKVQGGAFLICGLAVVEPDDACLSVCQQGHIKIALVVAGRIINQRLRCS